MAIKLWEREKKEYTQSRYIKQGDIFSFFYENQYFFFGRVLAAKPKEYCIAELFDYCSEKPEIDEQTKYPDVLYATSPELPLHLSDGDIKQYIDLDRLPDEVKAELFIKRQSKSLAKFWDESITKDNAKAIGRMIAELKATKLPAKEKKNAELFFTKYGNLLN